MTVLGVVVVVVVVVVFIVVAAAVAVMFLHWHCRRCLYGFSSRFVLCAILGFYLSLEGFAPFVQPSSKLLRAYTNLGFRVPHIGFP